MDSIGILGIKLLYPDRTVQHCGIQFQRNAHPSYVVWPLPPVPSDASADDPRVNVPQDVHAVTGAWSLHPAGLLPADRRLRGTIRDVFRRHGPVFQARRGGKRVFYEPASVIIHHEGKSSTSREVIDDLNARAASLFFKTWKEDLHRNELESLIEKEDGKYAYLAGSFLA